NTMDGCMKAREAGVRDVILICGMEIDTRDGEVLAIFIEEPIPSGLSVEETVRLIREQGGIVVCPHPFDRSRKNACFPDRHDPALWDAMEVLNAASKDAASFERAARFSKEHGIVQVASSDAHTLVGLGSAAMLIHSESSTLTPDEIKAALRSGAVGFEGRVFCRFERFWEDVAKRARGRSGIFERAVRSADRRFAL
ncbi:MAG TPA: PHP domain-containing protein, partial [Proteobacteria bacterium]|nr:PHP domain-containing protein [Pseudomonadota bacterium]